MVNQSKNATDNV